MGEKKIAEKIKFGPQAGPQSDFVGCSADIVIYGGAAGGGKTYALLLDPLANVKNPDFGGVIFRKTNVQIRTEGGLWDESAKLYPLFGARPRENSLSWRFPSGMSISFANLEYESDIFNYQGAQIPWMGFDELTQFSRAQFFYLMSRNRGTCGFRPCIRATCNPDPDSWVRDFIDWWIGADGYPVKERAGRVRYFIRINDAFIWANTADELVKQYGRDTIPKSVCFIPARLEDNKILMEKDPSYLGTLLALNRVDRMRLREGNWNVRAEAGMLFQRQWFRLVDAIPSGFTQVVRFWDRAATRPSESNKDPDWTRGLKLYKYPDGKWVVGDLVSMRDTPGQVANFIKTVAANDTRVVKVVANQDPGSAGVLEAEHFTKMLVGYNVKTYVVPRDQTTGKRDKVTRAKPVSAQCEAGNVWVLRAPWNDAFFGELENFPEGAHDDIVDSLSGAFNDLLGQGLSFADLL
jgi:predicted phage terminase large subunit-like protein